MSYVEFTVEQAVALARTSRLEASRPRASDAASSIPRSFIPFISSIPAFPPSPNSSDASLSALALGEWVHLTPTQKPNVPPFERDRDQITSGLYPRLSDSPPTFSLPHAETLSISSSQFNSPRSLQYPSGSLLDLDGNYQPRIDTDNQIPSLSESASQSTVTNSSYFFDAFSPCNYSYSSQSDFHSSFSSTFSGAGTSSRSAASLFHHRKRRGSFASSASECGLPFSGLAYSSFQDEDSDRSQDGDGPLSSRFHYNPGPGSRSNPIEVDVDLDGSPVNGSTPDGSQFISPAELTSTHVCAYTLLFILFLSNSLNFSRI